MNDIMSMLLSSVVVANIFKYFFNLKRKSKIQLANDSFIKVISFYIQSKKIITLDALLKLRENIAICYGIKKWNLYSIAQGCTVAFIECVTTDKFSMEEKRANEIFFRENLEKYFGKEDDDSFRIEYRKKVMKDIAITFFSILGVFLIIVYLMEYNSKMSIVRNFGVIFSGDVLWFIMKYTIIGVIGAYVVPYIFKKVFGLLGDF